MPDGIINVALVEDIENSRKAFHIMVTLFSGIRLSLEATDGVDLLEKLPDTDVFPDMILMNVRLPHMDGPATARVLLKRYPGIKIVVFTAAHASDSRVLKMLDMGCVAFMQKDADWQEIEEGIKSVAGTCHPVADEGGIRDL
jgi:DNA-binding NarL/FixJ family response regulator